MKSGLSFLLGVCAGAVIFLAYEQIVRPGKQLPREGKTGTINPAASQSVAARQMASPVTNVFHWSSVESADYRIYIANLRKIGCPEKTIRDIVLADVNELFAAKERPLRALLSRKPYWGSANNDSATIDDAKGRLKNLIAEKHQLLATLLGESAVQDSGLDYEYDTIVASTDSPLGFLLPQKQSKVIQLKGEFDALLRNSFPDSPTNSVQTRAYLEMKENFNNQLKAVLSEEELRMYKLHASPEASWIRLKYGGLNLTEEEFLVLYEYLAPYESQIDPYLGRNADVAQVTSTIRKALEDRVREIVGEVRYKQFLASRNFISR